MDSATSRPTVVVVGDGSLLTLYRSGVIGISCALKLQERISQWESGQKPEVLLVAREWPMSLPGSPTSHSVDYASVWAGAHVRPIPATSPQLQCEARWLKHTTAEFDRLLQSYPSIGITRTKGVELFEDPTSDYTAQSAESFSSESGLSGYRSLQPVELPEDVVLGFEYDTYCINSPVYCQYLLRLFILGKGITLQKSLRSDSEAFSLAENVLFVVNASGIGFNDTKVYPTRGQIVLTDFVEADKTVTRQNKDGSWSFVIPRFFAGGTIIGGTKDPGSWDSLPQKDTRRALLQNASSILNLASAADHSSQRSSHDLHVVEDIIGRRPTRDGGVRLELETRTFLLSNSRSGHGHIIHAYGAGGRGYELSWGIAEDVACMAEKLLGNDRLSKL
ncbi:unnamed protein product [Clonostachys byssicola]|uniref:FAD dependent oxidoreductase domain-containing protein n=1 Tax=Clonostachys byssicola TaxID=160290 RepID=A0A9N9U223_9HYPO|nr:unnamed protein product [Clonostachys byssicola]